MTRFIFLYHESREYYCWPHHSYRDHVHVEERAFVKGTPEAEILASARAEEREKEGHYAGYAGDHVFTRRLVRVLQVGRDLDLTAGD